MGPRQTPGPGPTRICASTYESCIFNSTLRVDVLAMKRETYPFRSGDEQYGSWREKHGMNTEEMLMPIRWFEAEMKHEGLMFVAYKMQQFGFKPALVKRVAPRTWPPMGARN